MACLTSPSNPGFKRLLLTFPCSPPTPNPAERAPFPWMWLGSGSSSGWRCSITGISGCHGVSRRFEKAEWWARQWQGQGGPLCLGEAQGHDSICVLDHIGGRWYLGLGEGVALKIEGQASPVESSLWDVRGVSQGAWDCWGKLRGWASS